MPIVLPLVYPCCITAHICVSSVAMSTGWVRTGWAVVVGVGLFVGVGCSTGGDTTSTTGGDVNVEVQACVAWGAAFHLKSGVVAAANSAAAIAPGSRAGQLMNVFIARQGLPGDAPESPMDLLNVQARCAEVGVVFSYPSASA
jgi:hypothetical protein